MGFKYSCFISYSSGQKELIQKFIYQIEESLNAEIELYMKELCYKSPYQTDASSKDIWGSYLAGQVLVESASLEDVSERNSQTLQRIKSWLLEIMRGDMPAIERVNAGNVLDKLSDDRLIKRILFAR
ncbi:MAG: hypothetical protein OMM_10839 [Candidatus Magnetoglobus multicellularis str. Araruama]|uniref:Uncharacterized protein n=1 Tax=Candidatus Magnetoglobus multicellularis str. Araruama TaxID=890399 RepID=A0A1V1NZY6_9BACT|nr:MAG: hypothetical protein OMM_10839 [Candidatus Magnetoglobus multicellularis str. Araruama]